MNYKNEIGQTITDKQLDEMIADIEKAKTTAQAQRAATPAYFRPRTVRPTAFNTSRRCEP